MYITFFLISFNNNINFEPCLSSKDVKLDFPMVILLDGNSKIGAHVWSYFICSRQLIRSREVTDCFHIFSFTRAKHVLSYYLI